MKIAFRLSEADVKRAIGETRRQAQVIQQKCDEFAKRLAQEGVKAAQNALNGYGTHSTGELLASITCTPVKPGVWKVTCFSPNQDGENYAWFVEYGTGVKGAGSPHPEASLIGWNYDVNGHGEDGWFYYGDQRRKHKWRWNPETEKWAPWTDGEPAKPFMYDSRQHIMDPAVVERIMREVFGS